MSNGSTFVSPHCRTNSVRQFDPSLTGRTTDNGVGKRSHAGLSLLNDIDSSTRGFCAILSRDLVAHERSLPFTYGRPAES